MVDYQLSALKHSEKVKKNAQAHLKKKIVGGQLIVRSKSKGAGRLPKW